MATPARQSSGTSEIASGVPVGLEKGLRNYWYPALHSEALPAGKPLGFQILGEKLVTWRDRNGKPNVVRDKCPHRAAKFSAGRVLAGDLQCAWHGLRFDGEGKCTMIPWEPANSPLQNDISVAAYPAEELGGYIWVYVGDARRVPPPSLSDCVPEELTEPDKFIWFKMPTEVWNANWLQCLEGSDSFHAVMLHSDSQAVANESWTGGRPKAASVPLEERRMKIFPSPQGYRGVALDREGNPIHHGHFVDGWKGKRWTLPCLHTIPLRPVPNADAYASRLYQFPIDETHTQVERFLTWRAETPEQRAQKTKLWNDVVHRRQLEVAGEDRVIVETLGDLTESRSEEYLFYPDQDILKIRRHLAAAFEAQSQGKRLLDEKQDFVFPV